jgi:hypothetical protein
MTKDTPAERVTIAQNFYFAQEDMLSAWAERNGTSWTVTRPGFIIGANEYVSFLYQMQTTTSGFQEPFRSS